MRTPSEIVSKLHPPRLPAEFSELTWHDASAAFGIGLAAGLVLYLVLRPCLARRLTARERIGRELESLRDLPGQERLLRQARLWSELRNAVADEQDTDPDWRADLYKPGAEVDHEALDTEILRLAGKRGR